jgi:hypothetical protein
MTRTLLITFLALAVAAPAVAAPAAKRTHIVEVGDGPFASVMIAALGTTEPLLLFDAQDADAVRAGASVLALPRTCIVRSDRAATTSAKLLADVAGAPCTTFASAAELARTRWSKPERVVVFADDDDGARVRAEGFAAATGSALLPLEGGAGLDAAALAPWEPSAVFVASASLLGREGALPDLGAGASVVRLVDASEVLSAFRAVAGKDPASLILTNPADLSGLFSPSSLSVVSGLYAAVHGSPVFAVPSADPQEIETFAETLMRDANFLPAHIVLVGDELALRSHRIPDPVLAAGGPEARGGGTVVRAEIFSEIHEEKPQVFPVGRIVAENAAYASLSLARRLHADGKSTNKPVIFLTNADEVFPLGETISRTTVNDLRNLGVHVRAYFRDEITPEVSRQALEQTDVLVWEGHPRDLTLEERGGIAVDTAPKVAILQGCYTLDRNDPLILIEKGTQAIVATSAAIYSAPGSGFARALFDSITYDNADLGTAVRDARNYLLALALLRRQIGYKEWHKTYRAALAFALWGDPIYRAPMKVGAPEVRAASWKLDDDGLTLTIPRRRLREVNVGQYRAQPVPRVMYGGLVQPEGKALMLRDLFATVQNVPPERRHACPPGPGWGVVSLYAEATQSLMILARPEWELLDTRSRSGDFDFALVADSQACAVLANSAAATPAARRNSAP